jgi:hypothetical protein
MRVVKEFNFSWHDATQMVPQFGVAVWGQNTADDYSVPDEVVAGPVRQVFRLNPDGASLAPTSRADVIQGGSFASAEISVGALRAVGDFRSEVNGLIDITVAVPDGVFPTGRARARGWIDLSGRMSTTSLTIDGRITELAAIPTRLTDLAATGAALDPIHLRLTAEGSSIPLIDATVFESSVRFHKAAAGLNTLGELELEIVDALDSDSRAEYLTRTLVDWATDATGTASLANGVFVATGIYSNLADWELTYSTRDPSFVTRATLKNRSLQSLNLFLAAPVSAPGNYDFELHSELNAELGVVPEPSTLCLGLIGTLAMGARLCYVRRRAARIGRPGLATSASG